MLSEAGVIWKKTLQKGEICAWLGKLASSDNWENEEGIPGDRASGTKERQQEKGLLWERDSKNITGTVCAFPKDNILILVLSYPLSSIELILEGNIKASAVSLVTEIAGHLLLQFFLALYQGGDNFLPHPNLYSYYPGIRAIMQS